MPFEAKPYFRNEMSSQVSKIANGVQKSIGLVWDNIEAMFDGENRQKAAERKRENFLRHSQTEGLTMGNF